MSALSGLSLLDLVPCWACPVCSQHRRVGEGPRGKALSVEVCEETHPARELRHSQPNTVGSHSHRQPRTATAATDQTTATQGSSEPHAGHLPAPQGPPFLKAPHLPKRKGGRQAACGGQPSRVVGTPGAIRLPSTAAPKLGQSDKFQPCSPLPLPSGAQWLRAPAVLSSGP